MIKNELSKALILESNQESINKVNTFIDEVYAEYTEKLNDSYGNMIVALTEAVNNAIRHGNQLDRNITVDLTLEMGEHELLFSVCDKGAGFDFKNVPDPTHPDNLDKPSGRGIFIMRSLADQLEFLNDGREVQLTFKR